MDLINVLTNYYLLSFIVAWLISILLKAIILSIKYSKPFNIIDGFQNGGMPSSHTTAVTSITTAIFIMTNFSALFFAALVFSLIIISDSFGLRKNVGMQGDALNMLLKRGKQKPLQIEHGHTFLEVLAGIFIGMAVPMIFYLLM